MENHCPTCKGTGKQSITVNHISSSGNRKETVEIDCVICDGGIHPLSESEAKQELQDQEDEKALWCTCNKSKSDAIYVPDGKSRVCSKHHWICRDCRKIVQIG